MLPFLRDYPSPLVHERFHCCNEMNYLMFSLRRVDLHAAYLDSFDGGVTVLFHVSEYLLVFEFPGRHLLGSGKARSTNNGEI